MSGLNISCGEFLAEDKAGSSFERVLSDLCDVDESTKHSILSGFDDEEYTLIDSGIATTLVNPLRIYRDQLVAEIGHNDWLRETEREEAHGGDPVKLKWGEGRGWRLYCATNLLRACEASSSNHQPVLVCLC